MQHLTNGKHIDEGMLTVRKAGGTPVEYLKIEDGAVLVTHVSNGGGAGQDRVTENVTLNFRKFTQTYTPQDDKGTAKAASEFTWDIAATSRIEPSTFAVR